MIDGGVANKSMRPKTVDEFKTMSDKVRSNPNEFGSTFIELKNAPVYELTTPYDDVFTFKAPSFIQDLLFLHQGI